MSNIRKFGVWRLCAPLRFAEYFFSSVYGIPKKMNVQTQDKKTLFDRPLLRIFVSYYRPHWKLFAADMLCASLIAAAD
ncbi:MAG: hypothetical protein LBK05_05000, partial [Treponema sp.]|nr:hypothetical protein [Treponema sp.]